VTPRPLHLTVNANASVLDDVPSGERLLDSLRWRLGLKGTKDACRTGGCGACTVLVDGKSTLACLTLSHEVDGASITTIEGIGADPVGAKVRAAFEAAGALQCGYCTPGFVMALTGLLKERGRAIPLSELLEDLGGNLCRCTGYVTIVRAATMARAEAP
jgi:aerobic carbon-monoxide dehydrogenase small subunit